MIRHSYWFIFVILVLGCKENNPQSDNGFEDSTAQELTIFFVNDPHGQIDNFAKVKALVDAERNEGNTLLLCGGDIFSGNPIVDQHVEKGSPMIDLMNRSGFNASVIGNHEFDYGPEVLKERMAQAEFEWICANIDVQDSGLTQPDDYVTFEVGSLKITVLGLVETGGKPDGVIPSSHPWRVADFSFQHFYDIVGEFSDLKTTEDADMYIALTHLGSSSDRYLAENFPYFDLIIGGHSHQIINEEVSGIPIVQSGSYLANLGRIDLTIENKTVVEYEVSFISLADEQPIDEDLQSIISSYNEAPDLDEVVGFSAVDHTGTETGCFYTDALRDYMQVDFSIQNGGGVRSTIDKGDITRLEIFEVDPFNNGSVVFIKSVAEIKEFLIGTGDGFHMSGITVNGECEGLCIYDAAGVELEDDVMLTLGMNDYIAAVYDSYFALEDAEVRELTTAESILAYLKSYEGTIDYDGCNQYQSAD